MDAAKVEELEKQVSDTIQQMESFDPDIQAIQQQAEVNSRQMKVERDHYERMYEEEKQQLQQLDIQLE